MKSHDRLGMAKILTKYSGWAGSRIQSPLAIVILIRLCGKLLLEEMNAVGYSGDNDAGDVRGASSLSELCFDFLESILSHSDKMLAYEAAMAICSLPNLGSRNLSRAMECLRGMLFSDKPIDRFAAVRTLSTVSQVRAVALCNEGLERCVSDEGTHIATLAVTTLLKTGGEATIDRILGNLSLLNRIEEEYKVALLQSLGELCLKYPHKHEAIVSILSNLLHEEGNFGFKHSIVNCIVSLIRRVPESTERSLLHLCEFIENCEYPMLSTKTMHIIADIGSTTTAPSKYIRFLCNRMILDDATIRAAAVAALMKFAASCPSLRQSILTQLRRCLNDEDDETRDRASVAVSVLKEAMALNPYIAPSMEEYVELRMESPSEGDLASIIYLQSLPMSFKSLEQSLKAYASTPGAIESADPIAFSSLPFVEELNEDVSLNTNTFDYKPAKFNDRDPAAAIYAIPELADFGRIFRSSTATSLTEAETEYVVRYVTHILDHHVILEFIVSNTVEKIQMKNLTVELEGDSDAFEIIGDVPAAKAECGETVSTFTILKRRADSFKPTCFTCQLNFTAIKVCPDSGEQLEEGYAEEYPLESLTITPSDFMGRMMVSDFRQAWNGADVGNEALGTFTVQAKSLDAVIELLGMAPCDGTGRPPVNASDLKSHTLHMSGVFLGGHVVLARAQLMIRKDGNLLKIAIRSDKKHVSDTVMSCIHC